MPRFNTGWLTGQTSPKRKRVCGLPNQGAGARSNQANLASDGALPSSRIKGPWRASHGFEIGDQGSDKAAGAAGVAGRVFGIGPAWPGDIEVHPGGATDELLEELRRRDGSPPFAADILEIGDMALELLFIIVVERQAPRSFASLPAGGQQVMTKVIVITEEPGDLGT